MQLLFYPAYPARLTHFFDEIMMNAIETRSNELAT